MVSRLQIACLDLISTRTVLRFWPNGKHWKTRCRAFEGAPAVVTFQTFYRGDHKTLKNETLASGAISPSSSSSSECWSFWRWHFGKLIFQAGAARHPSLCKALATSMSCDRWVYLQNQLYAYSYSAGFNFPFFVCVQVHENVQQRRMTYVCKCMRTYSSVAWRMCASAWERTAA